MWYVRVLALESQPKGCNTLPKPGSVSGDIVLHGDHAPRHGKGHSSAHFSAHGCLWLNGSTDQDTTWYIGRLRPRWRVRWGPSSPPAPHRKGHRTAAPPTFWPMMSIVAKRSPISATAELLSLLLSSDWLEDSSEWCAVCHVRCWVVICCWCWCDQDKAACSLSQLVDCCATRESSPNAKIIKNLCSMLCSDPRYTPVITVDSNELPANSMQGKWTVCTQC